jgi:hypothetical protein
MRGAESAFDGRVLDRKKTKLQNEFCKGLDNLPELLKLVRQCFEKGLHTGLSPFRWHTRKTHVSVSISSKYRTPSA